MKLLNRKKGKRIITIFSRANQFILVKRCTFLLVIGLLLSACGEQKNNQEYHRYLQENTANEMSKQQALDIAQNYYVTSGDIKSENNERFAVISDSLGLIKLYTGKTFKQPVWHVYFSHPQIKNVISVGGSLHVIIDKKSGEILVNFKTR